jgi:hypothetical protein
VHLIGDIREVVALVRAGGTDLPESLVA